MSSNAKLIAAGMALVLVAAAALIYAAAPQRVTVANKKREEDPDELPEELDTKDLPRLPKATLIKVFQQITMQMEKVIMRISQLEQQILQQAQQEDKEVDQNELRESMMGEFASAMKEVEARIYEAMKVTENEVEEATMFYNEDAEFQNVLKVLRRKYSLFTGQGVEDVPDYVTMQLIMDVMTETMRLMTAAMEEVFNQTKAEMSVGTEAFAQALQQRYVEKIAMLRQKVQTKYNIDQDLLQAGVIKYQSNPEFQKKMIELTTEQSEAYKKLGLA